jgi:hypothetical protein
MKLNRKFRRARDVSKFAEITQYDEAVKSQLIDLAISGVTKQNLLDEFDKFAWKLSDYGYWFILGVLWTTVLGQGEVQWWRLAFMKNRNRREDCLMKPSEKTIFDRMRNGSPTMCFRAHFPGEHDWLSYVMDLTAAKRMARHNKCGVIGMYEIPDDKVVAFFDRRGFKEIIVPELGEWHQPVEFMEI